MLNVMYYNKQHIYLCTSLCTQYAQYLYQSIRNVSCRTYLKRFLHYPKLTGREYLEPCLKITDMLKLNIYIIIKYNCGSHFYGLKDNEIILRTLFDIVRITFFFIFFPPWGECDESDFYWLKLPGVLPLNYTRDQGNLKGIITYDSF